MNLIAKAAAAILAGSLVAGAAQAKTLVYCSEGSPEGFDPALYTAGTTFDASSHPVYNQLVEFVTGSTEIQPGLAESWEVSEDGLEYTFKLRQGVKFHSNDQFTPTRDFNADDVIFSFERQWKEDHPMHGASGGTWEYFQGMSMPDLLKSIEKVDDYTVKFVLNRPEAPMIANLAMDFASIVSKEYADALLEAGTPEMLNQAPIGTGPFSFVGYQKDAVIRYAANPDYWKGASPLDSLVFAITPDASVRYQKLKAGECHVMPYPNPADIEAMKADEDIKLLQQQGLNVGYLAYSTQVEPFDDPKVRKALNMAMDKQAIIDVVFQGAGEIAKNPIPPTIWSYNNAVEDDPYDPEAAKKMLEEAGVTDLSMKIWAMPVQRPYNPNARRMAELIQADFAKVGVTVEIVSYEWGEYLQRSKEVDRDGAVLLGWTGDNGDPDNFLAVLLGCDAVGGANRAQWCYEPFEEIIQK
ncbi:MAG: ABC transporter substrate-binding protein, partial [Albimonas sp.]|uniref:ABC transporter substrate-binding protein n=1 Tax=Albimonas sp. TaxID=1872425 RepID=UPI0040569141